MRGNLFFRSIKYNDTKFNEWLAEGKAPAIPASLKLYEKLVSLGIKIVFLTGTRESFREIRIKNLKMSGYHTWEKLILKYVARPLSVVFFFLINFFFININ